jgi:hypothetical protein
LAETTMAVSLLSNSRRLLHASSNRRRLTVNR